MLSDVAPSPSNLRWLSPKWSSRFRCRKRTCRPCDYMKLTAPALATRSSVTSRLHDYRVLSDVADRSVRYRPDVRRHINLTLIRRHAFSCDNIYNFQRKPTGPGFTFYLCRLFTFSGRGESRTQSKSLPLDQANATPARVYGT